MPVYTFVNTKTKEEFDKIMPSDDLGKYLEDNPDLRRVFKPTPSISTHISNLTRAGGDWQDILKKIKRGSGKGDTINV